MGIDSRLENPVFRSRLGPAWLNRIRDEGEVFVIVEPQVDYPAKLCLEYFHKLNVPFRLRTIAGSYVLGTFPTQGFLEIPPTTLFSSMSERSSKSIIGSLTREPGPIKHVWYDAPLVLQTADSVSLIGASDSSSPQAGLNYGAGVKWAIIDTGVDGNHDHFRHLTITQFKVDSGTNLPSSNDFSGWSSLKEAPIDNHGHGTHVAGIITGREHNGAHRGVAPRADLASYRLVQRPDNECGREGDIVAILEYLVAAKRAGEVGLPSGINISLSVKLNSQDERVSESPVCKAVDAAVAEGFIVVVAAGNYGAETAQPITFQFREVSLPNPANAYSAIVVGACFKDRPRVTGVWQRSSRGPTPDGREKPDLVAPGVAIESAEAKSIGAYKSMSGTSQAAPHVSGVVCALLSESAKARKMTPQQILDLLKGTALDLHRNTYYQGAGMVQLRAALMKLEGNEV
jgi:serine protease AprX